MEEIHFPAWAQQAKSPEPWQLEGCREALRWFFRTAKALRFVLVKRPSLKKLS